MYLGVTIQVIAQVIRVLSLHAFASILLTVEAISPNMQWKALALALLVEHGFGQGVGMLRFSCSQLVIDRIDPLVAPDAIPAPHLHQIVGGNSFNASMNPARTIPSQPPPAPAAPSRKIFPTIGLRFCISEPAMDRSRACRKSRARVSTRWVA